MKMERALQQPWPIMKPPQDAAVAAAAPTHAANLNFEFFAATI